VITRIGGTPIATMSDLQGYLQSQSVGTTVQAQVVHADGSRGTVSIQLTKQPSSAPTISNACSSAG
jgi:S1-C subfamily serine protease